MTRSHALPGRRRIPQARDLQQVITILQKDYKTDGVPIGTYSPRAENVPARHFRATGEQIYIEDTLRLEYGLSFQIRDREVASDDLVEFNGRTYSIQAIIPLVPGAWLQLDLTAPDA